MERDRVGPLKEASLRAFDLLIEIQEQGGDAERMFFGVGLALMKLMEIHDYDRDTWVESMLFIGDAVFGRHPKNPDIALMCEMFRARMKAAARERKRRMS
jgi:hypothetical protein